MNDSVYTEKIRKMLVQYGVNDEVLALDLTILVLEAMRDQIATDYVTSKEFIK
jgi:uncharacterized protein (DUF2267 family)